METLTIVGIVVGVAATCSSAFLSFIFLRFRVESQSMGQSLERNFNAMINLMRKEVSEQIQEMRRDMTAGVKERLESIDDEIDRLRKHYHDINNKLQGVPVWLEQSKSNHERIARLEERVRDLQR